MKQVPCSLRRCQGRYGCQCTAKQRIARAQQQSKLKLRGEKQQSERVNRTAAAGTQHTKTTSTEGAETIKAAAAKNNKTSNRGEIAAVGSYTSKSKANAEKPKYCFVYGYAIGIFLECSVIDCQALTGVWKDAPPSLDNRSFALALITAAVPSVHCDRTSAPLATTGA